MKVELTRLRIKKGKSERVNEWLALINERIEEALETLGREQNEDGGDFPRTDWGR
jgi:hypothetical protein